MIKFYVQFLSCFQMCSGWTAILCPWIAMDKGTPAGHHTSSPNIRSPDRRILHFVAGVLR